MHTATVHGICWKMKWKIQPLTGGQINSEMRCSQIAQIITADSLHVPIWLSAQPQRSATISFWIIFRGNPLDRTFFQEIPIFRAFNFLNRNSAETDLQTFNLTWIAIWTEWILEYEIAFIFKNLFMFAKRLTSNSKLTFVATFLKSILISEKQRQAWTIIPWEMRWSRVQMMNLRPDRLRFRVEECCSIARFQKSSFKRWSKYIRKAAIWMLEMSPFFDRKNGVNEKNLGSLTNEDLEIFGIPNAADRKEILETARLQPYYDRDNFEECVLLESTLCAAFISTFVIFRFMLRFDQKEYRRNVYKNVSSHQKNLQRLMKVCEIRFCGCEFENILIEDDIHASTVLKAALREVKSVSTEMAKHLRNLEKV